MFKNLEKVRESFNLSKKEFAEKLGITQQTYQNYKNGRAIPTEILLKVKQMFNISVDWILTGEGGINTQSENIKEKIIKNLEKMNEKSIQKIYHLSELELLDS